MQHIVEGRIVERHFQANERVPQALGESAIFLIAHIQKAGLMRLGNDPGLKGEP